MEKTNELNKLLSYIHMGNTVYRIYYEHSEKLEDKKLSNLITNIMEKFKIHEETITRLINEQGEEATNSLTSAGVLGVYKERLKNLDSQYSIISNAIKATNMGMLSTIKFMNENEELSKNIIIEIKEIISDYIDIEEQLVNYYLKLKS